MIRTREEERQKCQQFSLIQKFDEKKSVACNNKTIKSNNNNDNIIDNKNKNKKNNNNNNNNNKTKQKKERVQAFANLTLQLCQPSA